MEKKSKIYQFLVKTLAYAIIAGIVVVVAVPVIAIIIGLGHLLIVAWPLLVAVAALLLIIRLLQ